MSWLYAVIYGQCGFNTEVMTFRRGNLSRHCRVIYSDSKIQSRNRNAPPPSPQKQIYAK